LSSVSVWKIYWLFLNTWVLNGLMFLRRSKCWHSRNICAVNIESEINMFQGQEPCATMSSSKKPPELWIRSCNSPQRDITVKVRKLGMVKTENKKQLTLYITCFQVFGILHCFIVVCSGTLKSTCYLVDLLGMHAGVSRNNIPVFMTLAYPA
jgi:hypothetical protein